MKSIEIQMDEILKTFDAELNENVEQAARKTAQDAAKQLRATSPRGKSGDYASGWTYKKVPGAVGSTGYVVYNSKKPQLTHLLENGHAVKPSPTHPGKKSRVEGQTHIKPVEESASQEFEQALRAAIEKG